MNYQNNNNSEIGLHALDIWQIVKSRLQIIIISIFLVFIAACIYTELQALLFASKTRFELKPDEREFKFAPSKIGGANLARFNFIRTELEVIRSTQNLKGVAEKLDLNKKWNTSTTGAAHVLKGMIRTSQVRGTHLIDLYVYSNEADLAAEIARVVVENYNEFRNQKINKNVKAVLANLKEQIENQKEIVNETRTKKNNILRQLKIIEHGGGKENYSQSKVYRTENSVWQTKHDIELLKSQISTINDIDGDDLIRATHSLGINDSTVNRYFPKFQDLLITQTKLKEANLGNNHPLVKQTNAELYKIRSLMEEGVAVIKKNLKTKLVMSTDRLKTMEKVKDKEIDDHISVVISSTALEDAKKEFQTQRALLTKLQLDYEKERQQAQFRISPIEVVEKPEASHYPIKPNAKMNMMVGAGAGLVLGLALAFLLEYLDTSIKTVDEVERYLQLPVIAVIPKGVPLLHQQKGINPDSEAYRILRTNIEFNRQSSDANAITIVSGGASEGKSTTLSNLAYICAQGGYTTLMIDADFRRPRLHTYFDVSNSIGLSNYLTSEINLENVILQTPHENLFFLPSGILPADATAVLNLRKMSELIAEVKSRFDLVLIDSPPILGVSDASVLVSEADLAMIVVQHRKLPRKLIMRVKQAVESVGGTLLGVVLNNVDINTDAQYQYYTSYYTYYSSANNYAVETDSQKKIETVAKNKKSQTEDY